MVEMKSGIHFERPSTSILLSIGPHPGAAMGYWYLKRLWYIVFYVLCLYCLSVLAVCVLLSCFYNPPVIEETIKNDGLL
jgi:hypothetical protein